MASEYYTHTIFPVTSSSGSSSLMRAELDAIDTGFAKLPTLAGNANKFLLVNTTGTAQTISSALSENAGALTATGALAVAGAATLSSTLAVTGAATLSSTLAVTGQTQAASLRLNGSTSGYVAFSPAAVAGSTTYTLPSADGTAGKVLRTSGAGVLTWASPVLANFVDGADTSSPSNNVIAYVSLVPANITTNVDIAITPRGTGAFSFQVADNATTGGDKRGVNAVDFSTSRTNRNQVASGSRSFLMGQNSQASGANCFCFGSGSYSSGVSSVAIGDTLNSSANYSAALGGQNSQANAPYSSVIGGSGGNANSISGITCFAGTGWSGTAGDSGSQFTLLTLGARTTDATPTVLVASAALPTASATTQQTLVTNGAYYFKGTVIAGVTNAGNTKVWSIEGVIKRGATAAATVLVGTPTVTSSFADAGAAAWSIAVTANTTLGCLTVTATGAAATTIRWACNLQTNELITT